MTGQRNLSNKIKEFSGKKTPLLQLIPATLGLPIGGQKTVEIPGRAGYHYARVRGDLSEVVAAYNVVTSPIYDLPVLIARDIEDKSKYIVVSRDTGRYQDWGSSPYLPNHAASHSFNPEAVGTDIAWIYSKQFMPLNVFPSGSSAGPNVIISPSSYYQDNIWKYAGGTGTANLVPTFLPTGTSTAKMVLVYLDDAGNPQLLGGSEFSSSITGSAAILQYMPSLPNTGAIPLAGIRLVTGTSVISWPNIYDVRPFLIGDGFIPTGSFGHVIQDDGVVQTNRSNLNFVGNSFVVYDNAGGDSTNVSGTSIAGSVDAAEVAYGAGSGALTSADRFRFQLASSTAKKPNLVLGSTRFTGMGDVYDSFNLALVSSRSSSDTADPSTLANLGLFGVRTSPSVGYYYANGTESNITGTTTNNVLGYTYWIGQSNASWGYAEAFNHQVIALENFGAAGEASGFGTKSIWQMYSLGEGAFDGMKDAFVLYAEKAEFYGELQWGGNLNHDGSNIGFFGTVPVAKATALTSQLTTITYTAPGTPDYALQDVTNSSPYGFVAADELRTFISVVKNLQDRVAELETKLQAYGLLA